MKAFTDIEQSKKLAEILPIESANMYWRSLNLNGHISWSFHIKRLEPPIYDLKHYIPCWSLAALLSVIPKPDLIQNSEGTWLVRSWVNAYPWSVGGYSNPVDACYELILKLHEQNLL